MSMEHSKAIVSVIVRGLTQLDHVIEKAESWAKEQNKNPREVVKLRLVEDMYPLSKQVQVASDNAKAIVARMAWITPPVMEDNEETLTELRERIAKTLAFMNTAELRDDSTLASITASFPWHPGKQLLGNEYLFGFAIPNFLFHVTTAYAILRAHGVSLGKSDFIGELDWKDL